MKIRWDDTPIFIDFETQSAADLKEVGGRLYAADPSTRVMSLCVMVDEKIHFWCPVPGVSLSQVHLTLIERAMPVYGIDPINLEIYTSADMPTAIREAAASGRTFVAHNAFGFDVLIWERFYPDCPVAAWADTLPLARSASMPGQLDKLASAEAVGRKAGAKKHVDKLFQSTIDPSTGRVHHRPLASNDVYNLAVYNIVDVKLMADLWHGPLSSVPVEADVIAAHVAVNNRGVYMDAGLLNKIEAVAAESVSHAASEIERLTTILAADRQSRGLPATILRVKNENDKPDIGSTQRVNAWLREQGLKIQDWTGKDTLRKDVVAQHLAQPERMLDDPSIGVEGNIDPVVFDILRLRAAAMRITAGKARRASKRRSPDGRTRDLLVYAQAHTGRWSSQGVQVHNLPRPKKGIHVHDLLSLHESGQWPADGPAGYDVLCGLVDGTNTVDDLLAAMSRPCITGAPGNELAVVDYAAIECRGVGWIADEKALLDVFAAGLDPYCWMATRIYGRPITKEDKEERQVGKVTVLGAGYSMSPEKFGLYAALQGIDLQKAGTTAEACIEAFRAAFPRIAGEPAGKINGRTYRKGGVWDQLAKAAMTAVGTGRTQVGGKCTWVFDGAHLYCYLPSGRRLTYRYARIEDRVPGYCATLGIEPRPKPTLIYTNNFGGESFLYGGKITENVVQAICRDLLATALVLAIRAGLDVVLHVHDEIVVESPADRVDADLRRLIEVMTLVPSWAKGFPIDVEGFTTPRYTKEPPAGRKAIKTTGGKL